MAVTKVTEFEDYKIVETAVGFFDTSKGKIGEMVPFGCLGNLSIEPETKTISKICSGEVVKETTKTTKLNCTISAHVSPSVAIEALGLTKDGLKEGVYGYSGSKNARGIIVAKITDMYEEKYKYIAFPNVSFTNGLTLNLESGSEEIAMMEMGFTGMRDENKYFYYQAFEEDVTEETIKTDWMTKFTPALVAQVPVIPGA